MDCEKFEPLLLDELYEELDELTSAAVKRHVSGCARCAGILNGLRSTRRAVTLPLLPVPVGLEDRILAATKEAQKVVPFRSRMSRALSIAESWAMRPQTAMAAVFLLMIGTSAFLIRSKNDASSARAVSVTVEGAPAPPRTDPVAQNESVDDKAAAAAHGPSSPSIVMHLPPSAQAPTVAANAGAENGAENGPADRTGSTGSPREKGKDDLLALGSALGDSRESSAGNGGAYAPPALARKAGGAARGESDDSTKALLEAKGASEAQDPFSLGMAAFRARNFAEATRQFDAAAQAGDENAALWAAESTRESQGCAVALGRFARLAQNAAKTWLGSEASLRAARCQIGMGQLDSARERLNKLTEVASHRQAAEQVLAELNQVARENTRATTPAAAKPAATAGARAPASSKAPSH